MKKQKFSLTLSKDGSFELPIDVRAVYGEARPPVKMTFFGESFSTRVAVYGGKYFLGVWKAVLERYEMRAGQTIEVSIEPDRSPRTIEPPKELATALKRNAAARKAWQAMSYTHKREWAKAIGDAKRAETRERRVAQAIEALVAKQRR